MDVSPWLRPDVPTSPNRLFCHVYGRPKKASRSIPGWSYSFIAALEADRTCWTQALDAVRLGPADSTTAPTAVQLREVVTRPITARDHRQINADIWIIMDSGYDSLAWPSSRTTCPFSRWAGSAPTTSCLGLRRLPVPAPAGASPASTAREPKPV